MAVLRCLIDLWVYMLSSARFDSYCKTSANMLSMSCFRLLREIKYKFETSEGQEYTNYRLCTMLTAFRGAQQDRMDLFDQCSSRNRE